MRCFHNHQDTSDYNLSEARGIGGSPSKPVKMVRPSEARNEDLAKVLKEKSMSIIDAQS